MVEIHYHRFGSKNEECNYLETTHQQRNELFDMINDCPEIFKDIEVNIVKTGLLQDEMRRDVRIREVIIDRIPILGGGKALLPCELKPEYRNQKICYCSYNKEFNETITTVFHELYHFDDPFDFKNCAEKTEEIGDRMNLKGYLTYNIKTHLSEYYADYKAAKYLSNQPKFKDVFMKKANLHFYFLNQKAENYDVVNKTLRNEPQSLMLVGKIFRYKFNERFFRIMAIRRGFRNINEFKTIQDEWNKYITNIQQDDYVAPGLYEILAEIFLDEQIESMEIRIWREFKEYFTKYHNFNLSTISI